MVIIDKIIDIAGGIDYERYEYITQAALLEQASMTFGGHSQ